MRKLVIAVLSLLTAGCINAVEVQTKFNAVKPDGSYTTFDYCWVETGRPVCKNKGEEKHYNIISFYEFVEEEEQYAVY